MRTGPEEQVGSRESPYRCEHQQSLGWPMQELAGLPCRRIEAASAAPYGCTTLAAHCRSNFLAKALKLEPHALHQSCN